MPTVHRFDGLTIAIYADDHDPPHFHIRGRGWSCIINISSMSVTRGNPPRQELKEALEWAKENKAFLSEKWIEFNERD